LATLILAQTTSHCASLKFAGGGDVAVCENAGPTITKPASAIVPDRCFLIVLSPGDFVGELTRSQVNATCIRVGSHAAADSDGTPNCPSPNGPHIHRAKSSNGAIVLSRRLKHRRLRLRQQTLRRNRPSLRCLHFRGDQQSCEESELSNHLHSSIRESRNALSGSRRSDCSVG
jgi:hypothetical protein